MYYLWLFMLSTSSFLVNQSAKSTSLLSAPRPVRRAASTIRTQRWRVNDTLVLECSQPYRTFTTESQRDPTPIMLWRRAILRGRRRYVEHLDDGGAFLCTVTNATTNRRGSVIRLRIWAPPQYPDARPSERPQPRYPQPLHLETRDFIYDTWDVHYRTWTVFLAADLNEIPTLDDTGDFVGNTTYHLLPYWIARERARLARSHRLPPHKQLNAYLDLTRSSSLETPYKPLLVRLIHAYQAYPMPAATAHRLTQALRALRIGNS